MGLDRFVEIQEDVYEDVLTELRAGEKRSHWMWFIFPQIAGLGHSGMARRYAIASLKEAQDFLADPLLGSRLRECVAILLKVADERRVVRLVVLGPQSGGSTTAGPCLHRSAVAQVGGTDGHMDSRAFPCFNSLPSRGRRCAAPDKYEVASATPNQPFHGKRPQRT